ncbi:hypothetical protein RFI_33584, partial [Reticulomyxa filosa]
NNNNNNNNNNNKNKNKKNKQLDDDALFNEAIREESIKFDLIVYRELTQASRQNCVTFLLFVLSKMQMMRMIPAEVEHTKEMEMAKKQLEKFRMADFDVSNGNVVGTIGDFDTPFQNN